MDIGTVKTIVRRYKELLKEKYLKYDKEVFNYLLKIIERYEIVDIATDSRKYVNNFHSNNGNILVIIEKNNIFKLFHYTPLVLFYSDIMAKTIKKTLENFENNKQCSCKGLSVLSKLTLNIYYPNYDWFFNEMLIQLKTSEVRTYLNKDYTRFYDLPIIQDDNHYFIYFPRNLFPLNLEKFEHKAEESSDGGESSDEESQEDELDKDIKTLEKMIEADVKN